LPHNQQPNDDIDRWYVLLHQRAQAQKRRFEKLLSNLAMARSKVTALREKINTTSVPKLLEVRGTA
jgi:hypothetical protein